MWANYCYWSVCTAPYAPLMEQCVATARQSGVYRDFHVFSDRRIDACECYELVEFQGVRGLHKLIYLEVGVSRLNYDYYVWVDADTRFVRNPDNVLGVLGRSPIHVPLIARMARIGDEVSWCGMTTGMYATLLRNNGVYNPSYLPSTAFWILRRDAVARVCELAKNFLASAKAAGQEATGDAALGYAMQMLCADPGRHSPLKHPALWMSDEGGVFESRLPGGRPWRWEDPLSGESALVNPAIIHLPHLKRSGVERAAVS